MNKIDYVGYIDTDSLYIILENYIINNIKNEDNWLLINDDKKVKFVKRI